MNINWMNELIWVIRIVAATLCGACIGYERENNLKTAGLIDMPKNPCKMQVKAETVKFGSVLSNYSYILYQIFQFTQNLKRSL